MIVFGLCQTLQSTQQVCRRAAEINCHAQFTRLGQITAPEKPGVAKRAITPG